MMSFLMKVKISKKSLMVTIFESTTFLYKTVPEPSISHYLRTSQKVKGGTI